MTIDLATIVLAAVGAAGIGFTWYLKVRPRGEQLNWYKLLQSGLFGAVSGIFLVFTGITVTDSAVIQQMTSLGLVTFIQDGTIPMLMATIATALLGGSGGLVLENIWKWLGFTTIAAATTTVSTSTIATGSQIYQGKAKVLGIYGNSAGSDIPVVSKTYDINMIPTLFFDLQVIETGSVALLIVIDNVVLKKWTPDMFVENGIRTTKLDIKGARLPMAFMFPTDKATLGEHGIQILTGHSVATNNVVWDTQDKFTVTFTGVKFIVE